ncbi:unnamed protein product [Trichobilharzia regenti]|nr:unnamed protein product [Trichobilharzia regenti]
MPNKELLIDNSLTNYSLEYNLFKSSTCFSPLLKWDFDSPTKDHIQQLNTLFSAAGASPEFHALLFHTDFRQHIKAIDQLSQLLDTPGGSEATFVNVDIILRWIVLRFFETNPVVLGRCMDYLTKLFVQMSESGVNLSEHEGGSFLPYLVMKVGDPKDMIRQSIRGIMKLVVNLYPPSRLFTYLTNGIKAKTNKTRQECLDEMGSLIDRFGLNVCQPSVPVAIKLIAQQIGDRDSGVRSAALNSLLSAYAIVGEQLWKIIGDVRNNLFLCTLVFDIFDCIPEKERSMLEERIKRSGHVPAPENFEPKAVARPSTARRNHARQTILNALLRTSPDTASAITMVVTAISSNDLLVSCHALAEIDTVLKDEKWYLLLNHVNQILMLITMQLRQLFNRPTLGREASRETLRELIQSLLHMMLDERTTEMPVGINVIRSINALFVRILETANGTRILR